MEIESILPLYIRQQCHDVLKNTSIKMAAQARHDKKEDTFALLQRAIRSKHKIEMTYNSFYEQEIITTILSPYHLYFGQRAWYIVGHSSLHLQERTFKVSRILTHKLLDKLYVMNKPFNIEKHFGLAWSMIPEGKLYQVKLHFSQQVAGNVAEVIWHQTQKLARLKDGALRFEAEVDGLNEIQWWIMGYGNQVKVLAPALLKKKIIGMTQSMTKQQQRNS
jgi:predicted DNA-binding transcriptional regulator YafY